VIVPTEIEELFCGLPGETLIRKGLQDLAAGKQSNESLLVLIGGPRLRLLNIPVPKSQDANADRLLYDALCRSHGNEAHSQYNSLIRQLSSFARALENRHSARERAMQQQQQSSK
jgi:hypothetical protein